MGRGNIPETEKNSTAVEKICLRLAFSKQRFLKVLAIMFDRRRCQSRDFGGFVEATELDRGLEMRVLFKVGRLGGGHGATLQREALDRGGAQFRKVSGIGMAQIPFGGDVQADRFDHFGNEVIDQPSGPELFVFVVDIVIRRIFREIVQHVPDVMQQTRSDQLR